MEVVYQGQRHVSGGVGTELGFVNPVVEIVIATIFVAFLGRLFRDVMQDSVPN